MGVIEGRQTAAYDGDLVVFLIGTSPTWSRSPGRGDTAAERLHRPD